MITSGESALLVDLGSGSILDELSAIGVTSVEWVVHTHHHRDQCQGDPLLPAGTRIGVPAHEEHFFDDVESFWQHLEVDDRYLCANVFSTLSRSVRVDRCLEDHDRFAWGGLEFLVQPTPGHTRGSVTYQVEVDGLSYAFCGDLIFAPGRVWTISDLQWDYSNADGLSVGLHSVETLRRSRPARLAPSHGAVIDEPDSALAQLATNMRRLHTVAGARYVGDFSPPMASDPRIERLSANLIAITHTSANFYALTSGGEALFFDYGFPSLEHVTGAGARFVEHSLDELTGTYGIERVDVLVPTHYHDDHVCGIPFLQRAFGTSVWAYDGFADVLARPYDYRLPATWREPIEVQERFGEGDTVAWRDYRLEARHLPGHTWYAVGLFGEIDGRRVGVTSDQIQRDGTGRLRGGGPVYRNRVNPDDFSRGLRTILEFEPELLLTGHDGAIEVSRSDLEDVYHWCRELEGSWSALAAFPAELGFALDTEIAAIRPYRSTGSPGDPIELTVEIRNHHDHEADASVRLIAPSHWTVEPTLHRIHLDPAEIGSVSFVVTSPQSAEPLRRHVVTADVELGEHRFGELAEGLVKLAEGSVNQRAARRD